MTLLSGLLDLWDDARDVFRQARVWERARRLALSQLASLALLPDVRHGESSTGRVVLAIDDTLLRKSGRKTPGVAYRRDPLSPAFQTNLILAQRFVQFSLLIPNASGLPAAARGVPCRWRKTGTQLPLRVVVIAPVGYRLTQGGRLLYRQPAYLICTDPNLELQPLLQEYLWRWDIEVNHRDEKQIIGVGQAQVRAPKSVDRQPAFAVACYSMLLLAALNACDPKRIDDLLPLPKWRQGGARCRLSTQRLVQLLRHEVWGLALKEVAAADRTTDFVTDATPDTKSPDLILASLPPVAYARTG